MIKEAENSWFKSIFYKDISLWDVKRYASEKIQSNYPIVKLGLHIQEQTERKKLYDYPEKEFGILGVNNKTGIFDAYKEKGSNINQSYKKMEVGWIAYNPYRVNVGSIGMRTVDNKYEFISPAYVVFSCRETLLPEFLFLLLKTERFNKIINDNTTGSVRQNLTFDILKTLEIPLPPISIQKKLLIANTKLSEEIKLLNNLAIQKEKGINDYILKELNIKFELKKNTKGINFTTYSQISRWATDYLLNINSIKGIYKGKYPVQKVKNFILSFQYGLSLKASEEEIGIPMLRMNNISNSEIELDDLKYINEQPNSIDNFLLNKGDLLFNRTNSKELVGKTAIFNINGTYTFASYLIRVKLDNRKVVSEYINYLFNSPIGRVQIDMISRQVLGQANINSQELQELVFPIPPLTTQQKLVNILNEIKGEVNSINLKAQKIREVALQSFQGKIFNN